MKMKARFILNWAILTSSQALFEPGRLQFECERWKEETKPRDFEKENEKKQNETEDAKKPASIPDSSELTVTSSL